MAASSAEPNPFLELVEALADRHGEVDLHVEHLSLTLPMIRQTVELNGTVTLAVKFRGLTEKEKQANVAREVRAHSK
jgi:hypothetical protein